MKIPNIFVPDKSLENIIQAYLEAKPLHEDPNLKYVTNMIASALKSHEVSELLDETYKKLKQTSKECMDTLDFFKIFEETPYEYPFQKKDMLSVFLNAQEEYKERIKDHISIAVLGDKSVIQKGVMDYVMMIVGLSDEHRQGLSWAYMDPKTKLPKTIDIDEYYITRVEERLCLATREQQKRFEEGIIKIYAMNITTNPVYDFMDNELLVEAVTNVKLKEKLNLLMLTSDEPNKFCDFYDPIINHMIQNFAYCKTCASKTLKYFCTY